jgi:hypothetical protein
MGKTKRGERRRLMAETRKKLSLFGREVDVAEVPILKSEEGFNRYELEDGTVLRVKNVATSIMRLEGQFNPPPDNRPIYLVLSSPVINVDSSPLTKKQ